MRVSEETTIQLSARYENDWNSYSCGLVKASEHEKSREFEIASSLFISFPFDFLSREWAGIDHNRGD